MPSTVSYSFARNNLKNICDDVIDNCEPVIITRNNFRNVVILSEEEYNNLKENDYIMSDKKYYNRLLESKKQIESGQVVSKSTKELEDTAIE